MPYPSDLRDEQREILAPPLVRQDRRDPRFGPDLHTVVNGILSVAHTGCQWRLLPPEFGLWTRVWSQFRRWSRDVGEVARQPFTSRHAYTKARS